LCKGIFKFAILNHKYYNKVFKNNIENNIIKKNVLQYLITNIKIKYSEISIQIHYKYYNKEKYIIILNHITNIKI
jgi:hypothetical protein